MADPLSNRAHRRELRGFTLIELLVALTAGILVSLAMFLLSRNAARVFGNEARISTAQLAAAFGLNRLVEDVRRAGFMSSPNIAADPRVCGQRGKFPDGMKALASVTIEEGGSAKRHGADHALSTANGLSPDALIIGGAFDTTEQFAVRHIEAEGDAREIYLETNSGAMVRTLAAAQVGSQSLKQLFRPGRMLRLIDQEGRHSYLTITGVDDHPDYPKIVVSNSAPPMPSKNDGFGCGVAGFGGSTVVNPVTRVLYDLRVIDMKTYPAYKGLYTNATHAAAAKHKGKAEPPRTELIRVELDDQDEEVARTLELVSEYAVDLKFGVTEVKAGFGAALSREAIGTSNAYANAGSPASGSNPQRIRTLMIRLSTRGSRADRSVGTSAPPGGGVFRYGLGDKGGFVRARTLTTEVSLPNTMEVTW